MAAFFLLSCTSWRPKLDPNVNYQRDLRVEVSVWDSSKKKFRKSIEFYGVGVAPKAEKYEVKVYAIGKADMITGTTCHREWKQARPKKGWFNKAHHFIYEPVKEIEADQICPLDIGIYEQRKGRHGWAMIEFENDRDKLPSTVVCNGKETVYGGVSACQAKAGLVQQIKFKGKVDHEAVSGCEIRRAADEKTFTYIMPNGDCVVQFAELVPPFRTHRHTFYGYDIIPIRGVQ